MSSSRLVLIFLGIILIVIVILSSSRIAGALKSRFGKLIPGLQFAGTSLTPTPTPFQVSPTPTKTVTSNYSGPTGKSTPNGSIPATGPAEVVWVLIGGSGAAGFLLRKFSKRA